MEDASKSVYEERVKKEAPQLATLLREMKEGLDVVRNKVESLTAKVKDNTYPTADGISYLEAKHLLLLSYCQSLVYYLLRKAKGCSIEGHPVVRSLVEIRLFLEKIRPIDKKMQYQIQKLTKVAGNVTEPSGGSQKESVTPKKTEDPLKYRPNPDMLVSKADMAQEDGVYKPPKFAPVSMEDDKISKHERNAARRENHLLRQADQSTYMKDIWNEVEGRPEEVREVIGAESKELNRFMAKWEERERQEEELFTRAPRTKEEKQREKHLKKSRNGLIGLTENFYDDIKFLPMGDDDSKKTSDFSSGRSRVDKFKKRKRKH